MKKIIATICAVLLLFVLYTSVSDAAIWTNIPSQTASPFTIEVIKLKSNTDATGSHYYTILDNAAVYNSSDIYFAIKLTLPSYADANAYYGTTDLVSGSNVKITIEYSNLANLNKEVAYAYLTDKAQTLWYDGDEFVAAYFDTCVLSATQIAGSYAKITASVGGKGSLSDISIGNNYKVKKQEYYGAKPCDNCNAVNLSGYLVYSANSAYDVFLSTANGKLSGVYVVDRNKTSAYGGAKVLIDEPLYQWVIDGVYKCDNYGNECYKYRLSELFYGTSYSKTGVLANTVIDSSGFFTRYCNDYVVSVENRDINGVYYMDIDGLYRHVNGSESFWHSSPYYYKHSSAASDGYYNYLDNETFYYGNVYYGVSSYASTSINKMTASTSVNNDSVDKPYLNSANYVLSMLGLSHSDIGNVYMSDDLWLQNFGFKTDMYSTADWSYISEIITIPIVEVPATGSNALTWVLIVAFALMLYITCVFVKKNPKH